MKRISIVLVLLFATATGTVRAQSFGVELLNTVMPASGGMAGASIARPQDVQSAIYGNPATMSQYHGTQFAFGGAWIEPTYNLSVAQPGLPIIGVSPFDNAKSDAQGVAAGNIGITQDLSALGMPVTVGLGLISSAGAGVDFRHIPESNGTHANIVALDIVAGAALDVTERLSVGAHLALSNATLDGPFVGITASTSDYALLGKIGMAYEVNDTTTVGAYWRTKGSYTFENLVAFPLAPTNYANVAVDRPEIAGLGISNSTLMDGQLLLAADVVYQAYTETDLFGAFYEDQWALQLGAQYSPNCRVSMRMGYAFSENPMRDIVGGNAGGVQPPGGAAHIQYVQSLFAAIPKHRITGGVMVRDVLPGIDWELFAGGMLEESQTFGVSTASLQSYWVGTGFSWRFGRGSCEAGPWE